MSAIFSFEIFPPKSEIAQSALMTTVNDLAPCAPLFWSVTDGAGGGGPDSTVDTAVSVRRSTGIDVAAHLTAINRTEADIDTRFAELRAAGIRRIVALRGDLPKDGVPRPDSLGSSIALIRKARATGDFDSVLAAIPNPTRIRAGLRRTWNFSNASRMRVPIG